MLARVGVSLNLGYTLRVLSGFFIQLGPTRAPPPFDLTPRPLSSRRFPAKNYS